MVKKKGWIKKTVVVLFVSSFISNPLFAKNKDTDYSLGEDLNIANKGAEYISGSNPDTVLMRVNLWGSVARPGIHYVPVKTDLVTLLSYAGGPMGEAQLEDVVIKRRSKGNEKNIAINVKQLMQAGASSEANPTLESNDIIMVPRNEPIVSANTMLTVSFVAGVLSIVLASIVLSQEFKK